MNRVGSSRVAVVGLALTLALSACTRSADPECSRTTDPSRSVARVWNEALLDAIRRDFPAPTVHSRNLFHVSAAMWDAWTAFDDQGTGYFVDATMEAADVVAAREEAISYGAYRVLTHRYENAIGSEESLADFDATMKALCFDPEVTDTEAETPAALGNRIAETIISATADDGSNETAGYTADYTPVNDPMIVILPGTTMNDPNRWQPLALDTRFTQNDIPEPDAIQTYVGPHWGYVTPFAIPASDAGLPIDPGAPPILGDPASDMAFKEAVLEVIRYSSLLDPAGTDLIDIGPGSMGDNPLGTYEGTGYAINPFTGEPYQENRVLLGDFGRVLAEFWADGPESETPPGHWNTLANSVSDHPDLELRFGGTGPELDRLEWDIKMYFALNGAVHDAAVAAWGSKARYDYSRPISMIRHMGGLGQSSDPSGPSYHPEGLLLEPGLVEVISAESIAPGARHEHLADHVGEMAILAWTGNPEEPDTQLSGVDWVRAVEWVPYQKETFVTPAFAAYVSGHSTFSRAGAEVLTRLTGNAYFPGGLGEWVIPAGWLAFEAGPDEPITLQWATYYDAADQAGLSRLYGGIHVRADDLMGRVMGSQCGVAAWEEAIGYFSPSA